MVNWDKVVIKSDRGETVDAIAPVIISASRSTDIPSCYSAWFVDRFLNKGHIAWINPFNRAPQYVSFDRTRAIIFWTKNPEPLFPSLSTLDDKRIAYYFQYTLNDYEDVDYEPNIPTINKRIKDFKKLSRTIGKERVIWRFDPILLSNDVDIDSVLNRIRRVGEEVNRYTERFVFSFIDLKDYKKLTKSSLESKFRELTAQEMESIAIGIHGFNKRWKLDVSTCAEGVDLQAYGINKGKCVDGDLLLRLCLHDQILKAFLERNNKKDPGQRKECGCIPSKDIGDYDTCPNLCKYCYANRSREAVRDNLKHHNKNPSSETITGKQLKKGIDDPIMVM